MMNRRELTKPEIQALRWIAGEAPGNTATRHIVNRLVEKGYVEGPPGARQLTQLGKEGLERLRQGPT